MAYENFIPEVWAEDILRENEKLLVLAPLANRQYEGNISAKGDKVNILGVGAVTIGDYDGTDIGEAEVLQDTSIALEIDKAKYFNVAIDDIDKRQGVGGIMEAIMGEANEGMSSQEDTDIGLKLLAGTSQTIAVASLTTSNVRKYLQRAKAMLVKNGVQSSAHIVAAVTPEFHEKLEQSVEELDTNNSKYVTNGFMGKTSGIDIYVSNNLPQNGTKDCCFVFVARRSFAHAKQISKVEPYRPEGKFCDAVKGLDLYGTKVVRPKELIRLDITAYEDIT
ncbi:MAG: hypothetical protein R3Y18_00150 [Bacillota bacterium]